jgi:hypothetical protein
MLVGHWPLIGNNTRDVSGNSSHASHPGRLVYTFYNHTFGSHPNNEAELDAFFTPGSNVTFGGTGIHATNINFSTVTGGKPGYLPADFYSWMVEGDIIIPTSGTYTFGVDADDATDITIDGTVVASWYGGHGFADDLGASHSGVVGLKAGSHRFRARFEEVGGGDGIKVYWRKPGDSGFSLIPAENFSGILPASGKIGLSGTFNGTDTVLNTGVSQSVLNQEFTISAWVYSTAGNNYRGVIGDHLNNTGLIFCQYQDGSYYFGYGNGSQFIGIANFVFSLNTWHHLTMVLKTGPGGYGRVFLNGIQQGSTLNNPSSFVPHNNILIGRAYNLSDRYWSGRINDVRVYKNAISDYQVKELAKAKIAHYTFDNAEEESTVNYVPDASTMPGWTPYDSGNDGTFVTEFGTTGYNIVNRLSWNGLYRNITVPSTGVYTFSAWFRYFGGSADNNGATVYASGWGGGDSAVPLDKSKLGQWQRVSMTLNVTNTSFLFFLISYGGTYGGGYSTWQVTMPQVEPKGVATPFVNGTRNILVFDQSGFNNNLNTVISSCPRWSNDSRAGSGSFLFNNNVITGPAPFVISIDTLTLSAWVKPVGTHSDDRGIVIQQNGNYYFTVNNSQQVSVYWYGTSNEGYHTTTETLPLNQWSHIATVWNGTQNLIYINGNLVRTTATNTPGFSIGPDPLTIGGSINGRRFNGYIDDVRQYANPLSAADIRSLYEVRAQVERSGLFYAKELLSNVEDTVNLIGATSDQLGSWASFGFGSRGTLTIDSTQSPKISGQVIRITNNSGSNGITEIARYVPLRPFMPGQIVTSSAYVKGIGTSIGKTAFAHIYNTGPSGTKSVSGSGVVLTNQWQRVQNIYTWDFGAPSSEASHIYFYVDMNIGESFLMSNVQFEYKSYPTPFTSSYRGATQLPSGVQFAGNEIHETGIPSFEDFSEVGINEALVGYWPLNGDTKDLSGFNSTQNTLTAVTWVSGRVEGGADLNGTSSKIYINNNNVFNFTGNIQYTAMAMIYPRLGGTTWHGVFSKGNDQQWALTVNSPSGYLHYETNQSGIGALDSPAGSIQANNWYQVVIRFNGINKQIFINGVSVATQSASSLSSASNTEALRIGEGNGGELFNGIIDEVKVFNRALSDEEIAIEYNAMFNGIAQIHKSGIVYAKEIVEY